MPKLPLLSAELERFHPVGAVGIPLYTVAKQIKAWVARHLGEDCANTLAMPQLNEAGTHIDWYSAQSGTIVPWSAASESERIAAKQMLHQHLSAIAALGSAQPLTNNPTDKEIFARQLALVSQYPADDHIYLVNNQPVLTFWGFAPNEPAAATSALMLPVAAAAPVIAAPLIAAPMVAAAVTPPSSHRWWLWLLPLLLLPLFFLKDCSSNCDAPLLGDAGPPQHIVLLLDTSYSMQMPMDMPIKEAQALLGRLSQGDGRIPALITDLHQSRPDNRRIDHARKALIQVMDNLPPNTKLGVTLFGRCGAIDVIGDTEKTGRVAMQQAISEIEPVFGGTPLALGLQEAASQLDGVEHPATLVVISDGEESCNGDPCALARKLKQLKPKLTINVVDMTGDAAANCLAQETGGQILTPARAEDFMTAVTTATERSCAK